MPLQETVRGFSVLETNINYIAFTVDVSNKETAYTFARLVSDRAWPELANFQPKKPGEMSFKEADDGRVYFALACRNSKTGNQKIGELIKICLDKMEAPEDELVALLVTGADVRSAKKKDNFLAILKGAMDCNKKVVVFTD